jgi:hypothetical protein
MKGRKCAGGGVKLLTAILFPFLIGENALAENPDALLSKESSKQMFALSRLAWEENARQVKAAGVGDFEVTPTGEITLIMRPTQGAGLLMVTPWYRASKENAPWKLSVTIAADEEPALSLYRSMSRDVVKSLIQASARAVAPEYSVMGYMARTTQSSRAPSIHFTIFRAGDFPPIDMLVKMGKVCPPVGGKQVCVRSAMIECLWTVKVLTFVPV